MRTGVLVKYKASLATHVAPTNCLVLRDVCEIHANEYTFNSTVESHHYCKSKNVEKKLSFRIWKKKSLGEDDGRMIRRWYEGKCYK